MNVLLIDTSSNKQIRVALRIDGKEYWLKKEIDYKKAQAALPMVEEVLKKYKLELKDLGSIQVNTGPGSFTGLRVGITVANTLSFVLKIPVNNKPLGEIVEPEYK